MHRHAEQPWKRNVSWRDPWGSPTFKVQVEETQPTKETEKAQPWLLQREVPTQKASYENDLSQEAKRGKEKEVGDDYRTSVDKKSIEERLWDFQ